MVCISANGLMITVTFSTILDLCGAGYRSFMNDTACRISLSIMNLVTKEKVDIEHALSDAARFGYVPREKG